MNNNVSTRESITNDYGLENEQKLHHFFLVLGKASLSVILKIFLTFERFEPGDSYKLDSYKKKLCIICQMRLEKNYMPILFASTCM